MSFSGDFLSNPPLTQEPTSTVFVGRSPLLRAVEYEGHYEGPIDSPPACAAIGIPELTSTEATGRLAVIGNTAMRYFGRLRPRTTG